MATRVVTVKKAAAATHATILATAAATYPVTVVATAGANQFHLGTGGVGHWTVAAATYTTITTFLVALTAATPATGAPALATVLSFAATATKIKVTFAVAGAAENTQTLVGTVMTQAKLATVPAAGGATTVIAQRLWQTSIGYTDTPAITPGAGIFYPGTTNDPLPITVENQSTHIVFLKQGFSGAALTKTNGLRLTAKGSVSFSNIGADQLYAVATTTTAKVSVMVGRR